LPCNPNFAGLVGPENQNWKAACRYVVEHVRPDDLIIGGINPGPLCTYHYIDPALRPSGTSGNVYVFLQSAMSQ